MIGPIRHTAVIATAVFVMAIALGGCDLGPDYRRPDTATSDGWREGDADEKAAWPSADWWQGFGSPELNEMITRAQQSNADLAAAIARVKQADAQVRIAGAPLLPSVNANAGASQGEQTDPANCTTSEGSSRPRSRGSSRRPMNARSAGRCRANSCARASWSPCCTRSSSWHVSASKAEVKEMLARCAGESRRI